MRPLYFIFFLLLASCNHIDAVESIGVYDVPIEKGVSKRIYTYVRSPDSDTIVHVYSYPDSLKSGYIQTTYSNGQIKYERTFEVTSNRKKFIQELDYQYDNPYSSLTDKLQADIKAYEEINLNHKIKGLKTVISYTNSDGFIRTITEKDEAVKDTIQFWKGESLPALEFTSTNTETENIKYIPFFPHTYTSKTKAYYVKGIGFFKLIAYDDRDYSELKLISIEKIKE